MNLLSLSYLEVMLLYVVPQIWKGFGHYFLKYSFYSFLFSLSGIVMCVSMLDSVIQAYEVSVWVSLPFSDPQTG